MLNDRLKLASEMCLTFLVEELEDGWQKRFEAYAVGAMRLHPADARVVTRMLYVTVLDVLAGNVDATAARQSVSNYCDLMKIPMELSDEGQLVRSKMAEAFEWAMRLDAACGGDPGRHENYNPRELQRRLETELACWSLMNPKNPLNGSNIETIIFDLE